MWRAVVLAGAAGAACGAPPRHALPRHDVKAVAARLPDPPIYVAVSGDVGIVIARVGPAGFEEVATDLTAGNESFGWIDDHTLVSLENHFEDGVTVTRFVDGKRAGDVVVPTATWGESGFSSRLAITRAGEVWLTACDQYAPDGWTCTAASYLRVLPRLGQIVHAAPADVIEHRTASPYIGNEPWPLPPAIAAPFGVQAEITKGNADDLIPHGVHCRSGAADERYPNEDWHMNYGFDTLAVRWVGATPPILEIDARWTDPVDHVTRERFYVRDCAHAALSNYAYLGDRLWAAYVEPADPNKADKRGIWTIYLDATAIGTLRGLDAMRATGAGTR